MSKISHLLFLSLAFAPIAYGGKLLKITVAEGKDTVEAELIKFDGDTATLRLKDGQEVPTPLGLLNEETRQLIKLSWEKRIEKINQINEALGHPLFSTNGDLWEEDASTVATRLRLPEESKTPYTSSYRRYTNENFEFAGAFPRTVVLYGNAKGKTDSFSLMFSNKGDTLSNVGAGEEHFDEKGKKIDRNTLRGSMRYDQKLISNKLNSLFGEKRRQRMQAQGAKKISTDRWDWEGHAFILAFANEEYVNLRIVDTHFADNKGKRGRTPDSVMKKRLRENVIRKENGDVYIDNIPMVDQGPKGYCAPATFERAMRYAEVPADMYLLATVATEGGGGTNTQSLFAEVVSSAKRTGKRKAREINFNSLAPKRIKKWIDEGIPVLWSMRSLRPYNDIANTRTAERKTVTDWKIYTKSIEEEAKEKERALKEDSAHHLCLIVGYNAETGEIAVSDSWGKRYTRRWVHHEIADAVTYGAKYVIDL